MCNVLLLLLLLFNFCFCELIVRFMLLCYVLLYFDSERFCTCEIGLDCVTLNVVCIFSS